MVNKIERIDIIVSDIEKISFAMKIFQGEKLLQVHKINWINFSFANQDRFSACHI